jgi:FkbH-like protein
MAILRTLVDMLVVRLTRGNKYDSTFLRTYFKRQYNIDVGMYSVGFFDRWRIAPGTTVGRYSTIAASVRLIDANHPIRNLSTHPFFYLKDFGFVAEDNISSAPKIVEDDVWMGHGSIATPECKRIGRGSIIGAGSIVMSDVPRYAIMTGAPARFVRFRFPPDVIEAIESTQWWLLDKSELKRGLDAAGDFLSQPSVESARAFLRALGMQPQKREAQDQDQDQEQEAQAQTEERQDQQPERQPPRLSVEKLDLAAVQATPHNERLFEIIRSEIATFSESQMDTPFDRLSIDSLGLLNLRTALEQSLGTRISNRKWGEVLTPADLLKLGSPVALIGQKSTFAAVQRPPRNDRFYEMIRSEIPTFSLDQMNTPFDRLRVDSLGLLNLRTSLEQSLGTRISNRKWGEVLTPADLLKLGSRDTPIEPPPADTAAIRGEPTREVSSGAENAVSKAPRMATDLYWLPAISELELDIKTVDAAQDPDEAWDRLVDIAGKRLDFTQTNRVDKILQRHFADAPPKGLATKPIRLAVLGSSTLTHLLPAIRVGGLRRGLFVTTHEGNYGQYLQELADPHSDLFAFGPSVILLALDAFHLTRGIDPAADVKRSEAALQEIVSHIKQCWRLARDAKIPLVQQTALPLFATILGNNEHRLPGSRQRLVTRLNEILRQTADEEGVDLLAIDSCAAAQGVETWHDSVLWHRAKQEVSPAAAPLYGDLVARLLAAQQGRSFKCIVLDLDNTLWGGVVGDDGLEGIVLGQGDPTGEAFLELQNYALQQAKRGIILAVCSKNDEANALAPFEKHPEMILKRADIACFVANWDDKAKNVRRIANELNIGLDSLVFVDDNPFERNLVRAELPMVAVPELPDDPAFFARTIAAAGYFEGIRVTGEDRARSRQYQANAERSVLQAQSADLPSYLRSLGMELVWKEFDKVGLQRIVQLINKTNQFNLTTPRYTENDILGIMANPAAFGLQLRLIDRYGDNGIIGIVIGKRQGDEVAIDTWLMSCRVLGRQVEEATLGLVVEAAIKLGAKRIIGEYIPTAKNGMVQEHYSKLGFTLVERLENGATRWTLECKSFRQPELYMKLKQG